MLAPRVVVVEIGNGAIRRGIAAYGLLRIARPGLRRAFEFLDIIFCY
jgi:hypothetical protein